MIVEGTDQKASGTGVPDNIDSSSTYNRSRKNKFGRNATSVLGGATTKEAKFEGREEKHSGYIYDLSAKLSEIYTKTTKKIAEYIGRTYNDFKSAILTLMAITINEPTYYPPGDAATKPQIKIWKKEIDRAHETKKSLQTEYEISLQFNMGSMFGIFTSKIRNCQQS